MQNILYGIGVGPGDPELMTLKALKVLKKVDRIFAPSSRKGHSLAGEIVKANLPEAPLEYLDFPMTEDRIKLQSAWSQAISKVGDFATKKSAAFVSLGDPFLYSSYLYLYQGLKSKYPQIEITTIPGVPGMCAAAARSNFYLTAENDCLALFTGNIELNLFAEYCEHYRTIVLYKPNENLRELLQKFYKICPQGDGILIERCGMFNERIMSLNPEFSLKEIDYFSIIILHTRAQI